MKALIFLLFFISLQTSKTYGAPYPATGTSALVAPEKGLFFHGKGFSLKAKSPDWIYEDLGSDENNSFRLKNVRTNTASLALRSETLRTEMSLETYAKRWMKDYSNYGFDLLGTQPFQQNLQSRGLVIDLLHKKSDQQVRQVLFMRGKKVVVFTCKDMKKTFAGTLQGCNQIAKTFEWLLPSPQKAF